MAEDKKETEEKKSTDTYELVEVPTQTDIVVRETGTENLIGDKEVLLMILNKLAKIEKAVC